MKAFQIAGVAMALVVLAPQVHAQAGDWQVTPLAVDGWSVHEKGEADGDGAYSVNLVYSVPDVEFKIGCSLGYGLFVAWDPKTLLKGSILVPVQFSLDGELLFERDIVPNDRRDYSWVDRGEGTDADKLVMGIWEKGVTTLTVSGGGASSTIPFNEEANGYWTEEILFACGLM